MAFERLFDGLAQVGLNVSLMAMNRNPVLLGASNSKLSLSTVLLADQKIFPVPLAFDGQLGRGLEIPTSLSPRWSTLSKRFQRDLSRLAK